MDRYVTGWRCPVCVVLVLVCFWFYIVLFCFLADKDVCLRLIELTPPPFSAAVSELCSIDTNIFKVLQATHPSGWYSSETHSQDRLNSGWGFQQKWGTGSGKHYKGAWIPNANKRVKSWSTLRSSKYSWDTFSYDWRSHLHQGSVESSCTCPWTWDVCCCFAGRVVSQGINTCFRLPDRPLLHQSMLHRVILAQFCCPPLPRTCGSFLHSHLQRGKSLERRVKWKGAVPEGLIWIAREIELGLVLFLHPNASGWHTSLLNAAHILNWNQSKQLASTTFF